jgi:cell wall-associated NlpC family hydrolase
MNAPADFNDLVGRPFVRGARGPDAFDCWGLVLEVRRRLGLALPPDFASAALTRAEVHALFSDAPWPAGWQRVAPSHGAVVMSTSGAHAGVLVGRLVLHTQARGGVMAWTLAHWTGVCGALECWQWQTCSS